MALPELARRAGRAPLAVALLVVLGCSTRIQLPVTPKTPTAPEATSPQNTLHRIEWCLERGETEPCRDLFTCDFEFVFSAADTAGNRFRGRPWTRRDEIDFVQNLLVRGSAVEPPATYVALQFDRLLADLPDDRPGRNPRWHRLIDSELILVVDNPQREYRVLGMERFYLVRGDSACIPQEMRDRGMKPDSTRWWIARWEDGVAIKPAPTLRAQASPPVTLGTLKARYLDPQAASN